MLYKVKIRPHNKKITAAKNEIFSDIIQNAGINLSTIFFDLQNINCII